MEEKATPESANLKPKKVGCGPAIIFGIILVLLIGAGSNEAMGHYYEECGDSEDIIGCMLDWSEEDVPQGSTSAVETYTYQDYTVTLTLHIPLEGGKVTGTIAGACDGVVKNASFGGQNNSAVNGDITGSCDPFFVNVPASAKFNGVVNKDKKVVPISFNGQGAGFSHNGAMSLSY